MQRSQPETPAERAREGGSLLLERERELEALERAMDRLAEGAGSFLLIEGPAGIGKTRLLSEAVSLARKRGLLVRTASGGELEREMPFGIARHLFEAVVERASEEERARLLSGSGRLALIPLGRERSDRGDAATEAFAPIHGLYWLLANLSESQPVVLAIDDAQWADPQTLRFLDYLARRLADLQVVVVAAARSGEPGEPGELKRLRLEAEVIRPQELTAAGVRALIAAELGRDPGGEFVEACARATGGNPFLVAELLRGVRADRLEPRDDVAAALEQLGPESVARHALTRLARFGEEAVSVARAVAVLGGSPQLRHAAMLAGVDEERAGQICDRLREAEILAPGLPIDFVHPLVRQAIYRDLAEGERSAAHRRTAEVLASTGAAPRELAPHLMACVPNGDGWVGARLREAATQAAAAGAHDAAVAYLERALKEPPEDDLPIRYALGRALIDSEPFRAPQVLEEVAERAPDPAWRSKAHMALSLAYFTSGRVADAARATAEVLDATPHTDTEQRLGLEAQVYFLTITSQGRDTGTTERITSQATELSGATPAECMARQALAIDRFLAYAPVEEVVSLAVPFPPPPWTIAGTRTPVPIAAAKILAWSGRWDPAREAIVDYTERAHREGRLLGVSGGNASLSEIDRLAGRLAEAEAEARTAWDIAQAMARLMVGWHAILNLVAALIARGDIAGARQLTQGFDLSAGVREVPVNPYPIELRAYMRLAEDDLEGAVQDLLGFGEDLEARGYLNPGLSPWRQEAATALVALDRTDEAARLISVAEQRARAFGAHHLIGGVLRSRAALEPRKRQIDTLRESVSSLDVYGPPHELAQSLIELGAALRRDGRKAEAREPLRRALELSHRAGAGGLEQRAREELAAVGVRPRTVARTGAAALTATELRTVRLAAQGLNNREIAQRLFVSRRTVETHLTHAYEKLKVTGRGDLKAALADQDGVAP